jgi:hypothetical protein
MRLAGGVAGGVAWVGLAIVVGMLGLLNLAWQTYVESAGLRLLGVAAQIVLTVAAALAVWGYRGPRTVPSPDGAGYRVWRLRFVIIVVAAFGDLAILVVLILRLVGVISGV